MAATTSPLGEILKEWRGSQGLSQLDLSLASGVSSRHISFIETGRSSPSREMVLRLAETLGVPLRERNVLLGAAGYAPLYRESKLDDRALTPVRSALERVLASHEPYPAFVLDPSWNVLLANDAHRRMLPLLLPSNAPIGPTINVLRLIFSPELIRPRVLNWGLVAQVLGERVRKQLRTPNLAPERKRTLEELLAYPGVREAMRRQAPPIESEVVLPLELDFSGRRTSWFSTIATIGTPIDITAEEIRIESMFPGDDPTALLAQGLAGDPGKTTRR